MPNVKCYLERKENMDLENKKYRSPKKVVCAEAREMRARRNPSWSRRRS